MWLGSHPAALHGSSARAGGNRSSTSSPSAPTPSSVLSVVSRFGPDLPFLLKGARGRELSVAPAHPDAKQREEGFAAEERAGVPIEPPERNYRDRNHKPELLRALDSFELLCGFRRVVDHDAPAPDASHRSVVRPRR